MQGDGTVVRWARAAEIGRSGRSLPVILNAAREALGEVQPASLLIASLGAHTPPKEFTLLVKAPTDTVMFDEGTGPLALCGAEVGVVALSGTGSRVSALTRDGRRLILDGLGPMLADWGSGYRIGYLALRAAVKATQHPRHATSMEPWIFEACLEAWGNKSARQPPPSSMKGWLSGAATAERANAARNHIGKLIQFSLVPHDRSVIASLARIVDTEARAGDQVAIDILHLAAGELAETFADLVDLLGISAEDYLVVGTGSVVLKSDVYWTAFCRHVTAIAPRFRSVRSPLPAVAGIALAALYRQPDIDRDAVRNRLFTTFQEKQNP